MYATLYLTWWSVKWAAQYADRVIDHPDLATAAIIGAVTAPVTLLQGSVFKWYMESKKGAES